MRGSVNLCLWRTMAPPGTRALASAIGTVPAPTPHRTVPLPPSPPHKPLSSQQPARCQPLWSRVPPLHARSRALPAADGSPGSHPVPPPKRRVNPIRPPQHRYATSIDRPPGHSERERCAASARAAARTLPSPLTAPPRSTGSKGTIASAVWRTALPHRSPYTPSLGVVARQAWRQSCSVPPFSTVALWPWTVPFRPQLAGRRQLSAILSPARYVRVVRGQAG